MGQTLPEIKHDLPQIPLPKLLHARSFFASQYPELYNPHFSDNFKVLVDENLDPHFVTDGARRAFGQAVHVSFVDLDTESDLEVWKYACANQFNLIVTKDRAEVKGRKHLDLTRCATLTWKWDMQMHNGLVSDRLRNRPRILQVMNASMSGQDISASLIAQNRSIAEIFEECISPKIELGKSYVRPGESFLEIMNGKISPELEQKITKYTDKLVQNTDTLQLNSIAFKGFKRAVRNEVMLEMAGDLSKIPFEQSEKRRRHINDVIAKQYLDGLLHTQELRGRQSSYSAFARSAVFPAQAA